MYIHSVLCITCMKQVSYKLTHLFLHMYGCAVNYGWNEGGTFGHAANCRRDICLQRTDFNMWSVASTRGYVNMRESLTSDFI
jgi:hypothetical protein